VYHLGEYSRVLTSFDDIGDVWRLNTLGTFSVLEFCRKNKIKNYFMLVQVQNLGR